MTPTFQSVILAGVYDVRNIKRKLRSDKEHKVNSPWNIASDFLVNMSFSADDIAKMLNEYEFAGKSSTWTKNGIVETVKLLLNDNNTLYQSLTGKLEDYPELRTVLYQLLFTGKPIPYVSQNQYIDIATMLGFIKNNNRTAVIHFIIDFTFCLWYNIFNLINHFSINWEV